MGWSLWVRFPRWLSGKESAYQAGDMGSIPGWEDPLEKELATRSSILAWEIPWTEEPGMLHSMGSQRVRHDLATKPHHCGSGTVLNAHTFCHLLCSGCYHCPIIKIRQLRLREHQAETTHPSTNSHLSCFPYTQLEHISQCPPG